jgi:hypothetical protein
MQQTISFGWFSGMEGSTIQLTICKFQETRQNMPWYMNQADALHPFDQPAPMAFPQIRETLEDSDF